MTAVFAGEYARAGTPAAAPDPPAAPAPEPPRALPRSSQPGPQATASRETSTPSRTVMCNELPLRAVARKNFELRMISRRFPPRLARLQSIEGGLEPTRLAAKNPGRVEEARRCWVL